MATFNQVFYQAPGKLIQVNDTTNEFIVSGYRLIVDKDLNRDLLIVQTPSSTGDFGEKGNISFDDHHIYYCKSKNNWLRGKLASWSNNEPEAIPNLSITNPTNWWKFIIMGSQPITNLGNYQFGAYQISQNYFVSPYMLYPEDTENTYLSGFRNSNTNRYYLNSSTNLVDLAGLNQDFSISFETSRRPNASNGSNFILGNLFGGVGFHFRFASKVTLNSGNYLSGDNIVFGLNAHTSGFKGAYGPPGLGAGFNNLEELYWDNPGYGDGSGIPGKGNGNRWINVVSTGSFPVNGPLQQIVATNNASSKEIKLYVNGELQATKSYANTPITNVRVIYPNSQCVGFGIGATPLGGARGPVNIAGLRSLVNVKNLGFWKNTVLDQAQITLLYNNGAFKTYPFV